MGISKISVILIKIVLLIALVLLLPIKLAFFIVLLLGLYALLSLKRFGLNKWYPRIIVLLGLFIFLGIAIYSSTLPNKQCTATHSTASQPPLRLKTAEDYFLMGNYNYDRGNCDQAISDYTKAININPKLAEAYNNRAYTYMMQNNYAKALLDLNKALEVRPRYVNALMNRGDIYNYYFDIDRNKAIKDYDAVIAQGKDAIKNSSVCGHRILAKNNGWHFTTILDLINMKRMPGC